MVYCMAGPVCAAGEENLKADSWVGKKFNDVGIKQVPELRVQQGTITRELQIVLAESLVDAAQHAHDDVLVHLLLTQP